MWCSVSWGEAVGPRRRLSAPFLLFFYSFPFHRRSVFASAASRMEKPVNQFRAAWAREITCVWEAKTAEQFRECRFLCCTLRSWGTSPTKLLTQSSSPPPPLLLLLPPSLHRHTEPFLSAASCSDVTNSSFTATCLMRKGPSQNPFMYQWDGLSCRYDHAPGVFVFPFHSHWEILPFPSLERTK